MTVTGQSDSHLGADLGLSDADLIEMYRYVALARAVDERMWILNRAGRIPFVISGQGHEGAQVGIAWAFEKGHDWIAPFYRSIATWPVLRILAASAIPTACSSWVATGDETDTMLCSWLP